MKIIGLLAFSLFVLSCKKEYKIKKSNVKQYKMENFPVAVGNWWKYRHTSLQNVNADTIELRIESSEQINDTSKFNCIFRSNNIIIDTGAFYKYGNRISYYGADALTSIFSNFTLQFPILSNSTWVGSFPGDTCVVTGKVDSTKILGAPFYDVYTLGRDYNLLGGVFYNQSVFLSANVGLIHQSFYLNNAGFIDRGTFHLIDYEIK